MVAVRHVTCSLVDTFYTSGLSEIVAVIRKPNSILVVMLQGFMFFNFPQNLSKIFQRFEYSTVQYSTVQCVSGACLRNVGGGCVQPLNIRTWHGHLANYTVELSTTFRKSFHSAF